MTWLDDVLASLQSGNQPGAPASPFPAIPAAVTPEQEAQAAQEARDAAGARMIRANQQRTMPFGVPDVNSAGVELAMNQAPPGTGAPVPPAASVPDGSPFGAPNGQFAPMSIGLPESVKAAKVMTAPPPPVPNMVQPGQVPGMPAGPSVPENAPTDVSAQSRPAPPPAPAPMAPIVPPAPPQKPFVERLAALGPGLVAMGDILAGHGSGAAQKMAENQQKLDLQAQQGNATARLLASKGASMPEIQAAIAGGPDTMKALLGQYLTKDKWEVKQTGEDKYGVKTFRLVNATDGTTKEIQAGSADEAKSAAQSQELEGVTGAARLEALKASDPGYARKVQAAVNGDISLPTGRAAMSPAGRKFIEDVLGVDGTVSEADFKIRQQVRKNYTSGKDFQVTKSINTVIDHGAQLEKAIEKLGNYNYFSGVMNPARDALLSQTDPEYVKAKKAFTVNAENFAREMDFALSGGRPTVSGAAHQREAFDALAAQVGQKEALRKSIELLDARLKEHQRGYEEAIIPGVAKGILPHLEPKTEGFIKRILGNEAPTAAGKAPKPGNYVYRNGALVPE